MIGADREPLAQARVVLSPVEASQAPGGAGQPSLSDPSPLEALTGEKGWFTFDSVPRGVYRLSCTREGFEPHAGERVVIEEGPNAHLVVVLRALSAGEAEPEPGGVLERSRGGERRPEPTVEIVPAGPKPAPDRWLIDLGLSDRYPSGKILDNPFQKPRLLDPYRQSPLKGDVPVIGQNTFLSLTAVSDTFFEARTLPTPSGQSAAGPDSAEFFGDHDQKQGASTLLLSFEMFRGNAGFRPVDWRVRATVGAQYNYLAVRERGVVNIDVRRGTDRNDDHVGAQELFGEVKLGDVSPSYDFVSVRVGIQPFLSDFRGFIFQDSEPGVRLFGSWGASRFQWNVAGFEMLEKDTNSGLNTTHLRFQRVGVANLYVQDFPVLGYTLQGSLHANVDRAGSRDPGGLHFDENGFLVRPAPVGSFTPHDLRAFYVGLTGDGHIGLLNLTNAVYLVRGKEEFNPIAGREIDIRATMAAVELSIDRDWRRYRASVFYASGDDEPRDSLGTGFDSILDNPNFAGGAASFWNRQGIRLAGTSVGLVGRFSLVPDLRSSKEEGQANFVNPGLFLYNLGFDAEVTPKLKLAWNVNYVRFDTTEVLQNLIFQGPISRRLGYDGSVLALYRPNLIDNIVLSGGLAVFAPSQGFEEIFEKGTLFSAFANATLTF